MIDSCAVAHYGAKEVIGEGGAEKRHFGHLDFLVEAGTMRWATISGSLNVYSMDNGNSAGYYWAVEKSEKSKRHWGIGLSQQKAVITSRDSRVDCGKAGSPSSHREKLLANQCFSNPDFARINPTSIE